MEGQPASTARKVDQRPKQTLQQEWHSHLQQCDGKSNLMKLSMPSLVPVMPQTPFLAHHGNAAQRARGAYPTPFSVGNHNEMMLITHMHRQQLPSVDVNVVAHEAAAEPPVVVTFNSAEDLADVLFPVPARELEDWKDHKNKVHEGLVQHKQVLEDLHTHKASMHEGLLQHKDVLQDLHTHKNLTHEGLLQHKDVLEDLHTHKQLVHEGLLQHRDLLQQLTSQDDSLSSTVGTLKKSVQAQHIGLQDHAENIHMLVQDKAQTQSTLQGLQRKIDQLSIQSEKLSIQSEKLDGGLKLHTKVLDSHAYAMQNLQKTRSTEDYKTQNADLLQLRKDVSVLSKSLLNDNVHMVDMQSMMPRSRNSSH